MIPRVRRETHLKREDELGGGPTPAHCDGTRIDDCIIYWPSTSSTMSQILLAPIHKRALLMEIAENPRIPSPPSIVLQVIQRASSPECTIGELCDLLHGDPGLCGSILRIVNSALFGLSRPATSIKRALAIVGINSARLLMLSISFPEMNVAQQVDGQIRQRSWRSSLAGAIVAQALSQRMGSRDTEDDMAAALLRDVGELILHQMFPHAHEGALLPPTAFFNSQCELEEEACGLNHAEVSAFILDRWRLPKEMTQAVHHHHQPELAEYCTPIAERRAYLLNFAAVAAQLLMYPDQQYLLKRLLELGHRHFTMDEKELPQFLAPLSEKIAAFAALLRIDLGESTDFSAAFARAGSELVRLSICANLDGQREAEMARRAESEAQKWRHEAAFDPLTKIFNRRFLENKLQELFDLARTTRVQFGVLFLDLDGFKPLNDRFGHAFGDLVLQKVADGLTSEIRQTDVVARFGGDEFCVIADAVDEEGLRQLGQRIWTRLNSTTIRHGSAEGSVGVSIGAVLFDASSTWTKPEEILAAADAEMYQAKKQGKNRLVTLNTHSSTRLESLGPQ